MRTTGDILDQYGWWAALSHGGLLVAPARLPEAFPASLPPLSPALADRLRRALVRVQDGAPVGELVAVALEDVAGLGPDGWLRGSAVGSTHAVRLLTGEICRPRAVWHGPRGAELPVFVEDADAAPRLGVGKGRRAVARALEWQRRLGKRLALLTNGRQWRLQHAGTDFEAHCEWDTDLWFEEGRPGPQVDALRALLGPDALVPPKEGAPSRLLGAIQATRKGQAELSSALGERVRQAVERLIAASAPVLGALEAEPGAPVDEVRRDVYIAATRLVMRCVVVLFAEARGLLPRENALYHGSYGLEGLREQLDRHGGARASERLRHRYGAWPRLLALFRLVHQGSHHQDLPVRRYGGGLFRHGDPSAQDRVLRAIAAFESKANAVPDCVVHEMLELLCRSEVRVRQGKGSTTVVAPVDFSDLQSEYIGILYEGLLDYELRRAGGADPMVFLNLGDQPALPFARLDEMTDPELADLLGKLKKSDRLEATEADEEGDGAEPEAQDDAEDDAEEAAEEAPDDGGADAERVLRELVHDWARRAVVAAGLVKKAPKGGGPAAYEAWEADRDRVARSLVRKVVLPGDYYLVRWGGTRKGAGTFYTRPQLAGPMALRALEPLLYDGDPTDPEARTPRLPEQILALRVCDPAMGSASFLIAALRVITRALAESLHVHGRLQRAGDGTIYRLADGRPAELTDDPVPVPPDHPELDDRLVARLRRHVVERCLYGVDIDPLAVELGRMALWVETMDRELPFGFLDHKLKCGNALVGCWFDQFRDYPIMAWEREGGDKSHTNFVHHQHLVKGKPRGDVWTEALKGARARAREELKERLGVVAFGQRFIQGDLLRGGATPESVHDDAATVLAELHEVALTAEDDRERLYRERFQGSPELRELRGAFDRWCAVWFWPGDAVEHAPMPATLHAPAPQTQALVERLARQHRFFHWELEFPDVFDRAGSGFDAVIGNPPWETQKPVSMEFFSNHDPLYRTYTKQQALARQTALFTADRSVEDAWVAYGARFKALSNWTRSAGQPFGPSDDGRPAPLWRGAEPALRAWAEARAGQLSYTDREHPFVHQGSADVNTYKLFLELGRALLRKGGRLGLLLPSGLYTDSGSRDLRALLLRRCAWTHLYAFQNERFVFAHIHHSFKMAILHATKGGSTASIATRFRLGPGDSPEVQEAEEDLLRPGGWLALPAERIARFSPRSGSLLEVRSERDLAILEKMYANGVLLGDDGPGGWGIRYSREFDMTNDSKLFHLRTRLEAEGYRSDEYGHWLKGPWRESAGEGPRDWSVVRSADGRAVLPVEGIEDVALPLYQGVMIHQFDFAPKAWVSGTGLRARWDEVPWTAKRVGPQFLTRLSDVGARLQGVTVKLAVRRVARNTDSRTLIGSVLGPVPCGDKAAVLTPEAPELLPPLAALVNSLTLDSLARLRAGGTQLDYHIVAEFPLIRPERLKTVLAELASRLNLGAPAFARFWSSHVPVTAAWRQLWAITPPERLRLRAILDAVVAKLYGLSADDLGWILRDCDHPVDRVCDKPFSRTLDPKGFWRVDKDKPPELRHTVLSLVAFHELERVGLDAFLAQNDGDGWALPETLRLADYGLGHDSRATSHQPVAAALGERFLPWQLAQSPEESWEECRRHAELIDRILGVPRAEPAPEPGATERPPSGGAPPPTDLLGDPIQTDLFGNPVYTQPKRRR